MDTYVLVALLLTAYVTTCQGQLDALLDGMGGLGMMMGGGAGGMSGGAAGLAGLSGSELAEMTGGAGALGRMGAGGLGGMSGLGALGGGGLSALSEGGLSGLSGLGGLGAGGLSGLGEGGLSGMGAGAGGLAGLANMGEGLGGGSGSMDLNTMMGIMKTMGGGGGGAVEAPSRGNDMTRVMQAMKASGISAPAPTSPSVPNTAGGASQSSILETMVAPMIAETLSYFKMLEIVKAVLGPHAHPNDEMINYSKGKGKAPSSIKEMVPYMNMMLDLSKKIGIYMPDGTVKKPEVVTITNPLGLLSTTADGKIAMKSTPKPPLEVVRDLIIQRGVLWFKSQKPPPPLPGLGNGFKI